MYPPKGRAWLLLILAPTVCVASCAKRDPINPDNLDSTKAPAFVGAPTSDIVFISTQMNPVEEAGKMRNVILKDFPGKVDFRPNDNGYLLRQFEMLLKTDPSASILIGALHSDLVTLQGQGVLLPLAAFPSGIGNRDIPDNLMQLSKLDGESSYYVPWMQASFVMVANKKALAFLPERAVLGELTYDQLFQWAKNIYDRKGLKALGFPAGEKGLIHRFFQGYLYPSYTARAVLKFRSVEARGMWDFFRGLWQLTDPGSLVYSTMAEPLITEDVWIAWDHTARLVKAFEERPNDFIAFPAPIGPRGRGFTPIISGLAIPAAVGDRASPAMLINYLTSPAIQHRTLLETGFFPVVSSGMESGVPERLKALVAAVDAQTNSRLSIPTLLPSGLGERGADYNSLFVLTFSEIVLDGKEIGTVLDENAAELQLIIDEQNVKGWLPDDSGARPIKIE